MGCNRFGAALGGDSSFISVWALPSRRFGVRGFPTLKFFSKSDKSGNIVYKGQRDLASFKAFVDQQVCCIGMISNGDCSPEHIPRMSLFELEPVAEGQAWHRAGAALTFSLSLSLSLSLSVAGQLGGSDKHWRQLELIQWQHFGNILGSGILVYLCKETQTDKMLHLKKQCRASSKPLLSLKSTIRAQWSLMRGRYLRESISSNTITNRQSACILLCGCILCSGRANLQRQCFSRLGQHDMCTARSPTPPPTLEV